MRNSCGPRQAGPEQDRLHFQRRSLYRPLLRCPIRLLAGPQRPKSPTRCCVIASWTRRVQVGRMPAPERILGTFLSSAAANKNPLFFVRESLFGTSWRQVGTATLKWGGFIPVSFFLKFTFVGAFVAFRETLAHRELLSPTSAQLGIKHSSLRNHL